MSFLQSSDDLSVKLELLRAKALAMEFEKLPFYGQLLSRTQNPKTTLVVPSIPFTTTKPPITLMDAFFKIREENQARYVKGTTTLMDVILDSRDNAKKAAKKTQSFELDDGALADDEESEEETDQSTDSSDWESQESDVEGIEDEAEGMAVTCTLSAKARTYDYDGDSELSSALSEPETSSGYEDDDGSDKENTPIVGSPASDKENDPSLTTVTPIRAVMGVRRVLGDVPGSNFDADKENVPLRSLSTTVAIDRRDRVPLQDVEGSNYDAEKENRVLDTPTEERSPLAEQYLEVGDGEGAEVQGSTASDEERGQEASVCFRPLATLYLRRRSIIEVSPVRPGVTKENGAAESLEVTTKDHCETVPHARSALSPLEK